MATAKTPVTLVSRHSDEYAKVEHTLQLSLRSTSSKDISIWSISNPSLNIQYERRSNNLLTLDAWVDINTLETSNSLEEICKRGFIINDNTKGLEFLVGNIRLPETAQAGHQYLLCSIVVGRSYVVDGTEPGADIKLPNGYDSIYLHMGEESTTETYRHRYIIFDATQVLPKYVVHFTFNPTTDSHTSTGRKPIGAIDLSDIKARIAETLAVLGPAAAEATEKMLSDIGDAYDAALAASNEVDPLLDERKRSILEALRNADAKLTAIQANSQAIEEELFQRMQTAMFQLQDETQRKTNALLSEELELRRQLGQIDWNESFVRIMQESLPPMTFVSAWERHAKLKTNLYNTLGGKVSTNSLDNIQADMKLEGSINVITTSTKVAPTSTTNTNVGARFLGGLSTPSASDNTANTIATPAAVNDIWSAVLKGAIGGTSSNTSSSTNTNTAVPIITVEQAQANLALAKADLAAIESTAAALPRDMRNQMDAAQAQAVTRVREAENLYNQKAGKTTTTAPVVPTVTSLPTVPVVPKADNASVVSSKSSVAGPTTEPVTTTNTNTAPVTTTTTNPTGPIPKALQAPLDQRIARYSLKREADRRRRQRGIDLDAGLAFPGSGIITSDQAVVLYTCLPFGQTVDDGSGGTMTNDGLGLAPPVTRLLFSSIRNPDVSIRGLLTAYTGSGNNEPTVVLIRANNQIFGGYSADPWDLQDLFGGSPRSFLFSISKDTKIPYIGRVKGPRQANDDILRQEWEMANQQANAEFEEMLNQARELNGGAEPTFDEAGRLLVKQVDPITGLVNSIPVPVPRAKPFVRHDCIKSNPESIQFGIKDLVLTGEFEECSSELENSYGIGLRNDEARTFLAGSNKFRIEMIELWSISSLANNNNSNGNNGMTNDYTFATPNGRNQDY